MRTKFGFTQGLNIARLGLDEIQIMTACQIADRLDFDSIWSMDHSNVPQWKNAVVNDAWQPDIRRAREVLGWVPRVSLRDGLPPTIEYLGGVLVAEGAAATRSALANRLMRRQRADGRLRSARAPRDQAAGRNGNEKESGEEDGKENGKHLPVRENAPAPVRSRNSLA
jgi:hypothetical protein